MQSATVRRQEILEKLCECRQATVDELAQTFHVSERTIRRDVQILMLSYPIDTTIGRGGHVFIADGYKLGKKYMTEEQTALLEKISEDLEGEEQTALKGIIDTFKHPGT